MCIITLPKGLFIFLINILNFMLGMMVFIKLSSTILKKGSQDFWFGDTYCVEMIQHQLHGLLKERNGLPLMD